MEKKAWQTAPLCLLSTVWNERNIVGCFLIKGFLFKGLSSLFFVTFGVGSICSL